jgi:hypothetical protein
MERIKSNKYALLLFIATIAMLVLGVVGIIISITGLESAVETARQEAVKTGATQEQIDFAVSFAKAVVYVAVVIGSILLIFEVLCGLKCSMYGKWRIGAIVFGILLCLDYVWAITRGGWMNWISALIAGFYLVGAIMCKPDAPVAQDTTSAE